MDVSRVILHLLIVVSQLLYVTSETVKNQNETSVSGGPNVVSEGGSVASPSTDTTHMGREHMIPVNHTKVSNATLNVTNSKHMIKVNHTKVPAFEVGQKNDNKTSVPKKDAVLTEEKGKSTSTKPTRKTSTTSTTSTTPEPHKPTMTLGEDEEPLVSKDKAKEAKVQGISIESVSEKTKKTDYVVPIVAVILSVPLVAIVFSVLYKRGADWWQHRHYRRMDFLIEGMYNN